MSASHSDRGSAAYEPGPENQPTPLAPVRSCCGHRHDGFICADGKVMCANCFGRFDVASLMVDEGETWNVCKGCAAYVRR